MNLFGRTKIQNADDETPSWVTEAMKGRIRNATIKPKVFYAMHFCAGTAEYREQGQAPYRVLINEGTAKKMDASFQGCPVVVLHTDEELSEMLPDIMEKADGFVMESFFNEADGKHWAKILAVTDEAHQAIAKGWAVSNCYKIRSKGRGGMWNGIDYNNEVLEGIYEHLAIVPNPRYESKILTPEAFKAYNAEKKLELERLANSTQGEKSMPKFNFFKKAKVEKVENAADVENMVVDLPKSKKQMSIAECVEIADTVTNMAGYCNMDHMVKVGEEEMSVNELVSRFSKMNAEKAEEDEDANEGAAVNEDDEGEGEEEAEEDADLENAADEEEEETAAQKKARLKNEADKKAKADLAAKKAKKAAGKDHFANLSNAADLAALKAERESEAYDSTSAQLARGAERYGSAKK